MLLLYQKKMVEFLLCQWENNGNIFLIFYTFQKLQDVQLRLCLSRNLKTSSPWSKLGPWMCRPYCTNIKILKRCWWLKIKIVQIKFLISSFPWKMRWWGGNGPAPPFGGKNMLELSGRCLPWTGHTLKSPPFPFKLHLASFWIHLH